MTFYGGYILMDACIISFNLNCIMQFKQFYKKATKISSRKKCYYFWWSTWLFSWVFTWLNDIVILGPLARHVMLRIAHAPGISGTFSPPSTPKEMLVSDPGMHYGACITHVPWCMSGLLTRSGGENVPSIPGACTTRTFTYLTIAQKVQTCQIGTETTSRVFKKMKKLKLVTRCAMNIKSIVFRKRHAQDHSQLFISI